MANLTDNLKTLEQSKQDIKNAIISKGVTPAGGLTTYDEAINGIITPLNQNKTINVTGNGSQTITFDAGFTGLGNVVIDTSIPAIMDLTGTGWESEEIFPVIANRADVVGLDLNETRRAYAKRDPTLTNADELYQGWNNLVYAPIIDTSNIVSARFLFHGCDKLTILPSYDFSNLEDAFQLFGNCHLLKTIPPMKTAKIKDLGNAFIYCTSLTEIPYMDTSHTTNVFRIFWNCISLKKIPKLNFSSVLKMDMVFHLYNSPGGVKFEKLTDIGGFTGLKVNWNDDRGLNNCPNLTKQSVINILTELADVKTLGLGTKTIKFHPNSLALLTPDELAIGTNKGWNIIS